MEGRCGIFFASLPEWAPPIRTSCGGASTKHLPRRWRLKVGVLSLFGRLLRKLAICARGVGDRRHSVPRAPRANREVP